MADSSVAAGAAAVVDDHVPPGITTKQDEIIQYVAKYVVASCDGARYQDKVRTRTRHNPFFDFLHSHHAYHQYYQYLLESYRHWMRNSEAVGGAWGGGGGADDVQQQQQQQWSEADYYQYYGDYAGQASGIHFQDHVDTAGNVQGQQQQQQQQQQPLSSAGYDPSAVGPEPTLATAATSSAVAAAADEVEDDEEYELVMEDGQWVSRKRT
ncbi:RNA binding protein [Novymonas esmeraldas]|uniref:RNA binding protein n=1 Tax=Novymonas esmeraldas TaxID=1808958 RepID=A0AAW0EX91_9TRYP